ncbi:MULTISPECIES: (p)ppGpp synthetase [unclassified Clostridium]|uniref:GTP pyrophosphokinase n=1 Tax=unclassified Clostridium TaxID=2614128 RepID=UPI001C8C31B0|nr:MULTISPECIES: (p)ppGpp synthetase [unclassified Clostridium]MBX9135932.1 (p)ppGpp synthetase [Clostridium sp. K12(2020)]MBX9142662.1 (p)ppGpp synthetase [Clostridium sp. K13]MDU2291669.1 (p)ppGpp synthetase [Clostridium celatum]MDU4326873.1 (p)ppGpp synthetase [Clostridium celatum]
MNIKEFDYLEIALNELKDNNEALIKASMDLEKSFFNILDESYCEFSNISCRVKSIESLREKILRNHYYKRYPNANELIYKLSDLIGIRIECRFGDDEKKIYRFLKKYFNKKSDNDFFFSDSSNNIFLKLSGKQPQKQKNGFTIYRIDGKFTYNNLIIPFELQIKSLTNMFWSEIEHQIIYKNSNYVIEDKFLKDIMNSIKNNLTMIDNQLLTVLNHVEAKKSKTNASNKRNLQEIVSKFIYDMFSTKMKESIDMSINFKDSCETIVEYVFFKNNISTDNDYTNVLINALNRINLISDEKLDFNSYLNFERNIIYDDSFKRIIGEYFESVINSEFSWNLFFRILFTLEPLDNIGDFEKFLSYLKVSYTESKYINRQKDVLISRFSNDFLIIDEAIKTQIAKTLVSIDKINIVYEYSIEEVNDAVEYIYKYIYDNINTIEQWVKNSDAILLHLHNEILEALE